jgi:hypothetical protein
LDLLFFTDSVKVSFFLPGNKLGLLAYGFNALTRQIAILNSEKPPMGVIY